MVRLGFMAAFAALVFVALTNTLAHADPGNGQGQGSNQPRSQSAEAWLATQRRALEQEQAALRKRAAELESTTRKSIADQQSASSKNSEKANARSTKATSHKAKASSAKSKQAKSNSSKNWSPASTPGASRSDAAREAARQKTSRGASRQSLTAPAPSATSRSVAAKVNSSATPSAGTATNNRTMVERLAAAVTAATSQDAGDEPVSLLAVVMSTTIGNAVEPPSLPKSPPLARAEACAGHSAKHRCGSARGTPDSARGPTNNTGKRASHGKHTSKRTVDRQPDGGKQSVAATTTAGGGKATRTTGSKATTPRSSGHKDATANVDDAVPVATTAGPVMSDSQPGQHRAPPDTPPTPGSSAHTVDASAAVLGCILDTGLLQPTFGQERFAVHRVDGSASASVPASSPD